MHGRRIALVVAPLALALVLGGCSCTPQSAQEPPARLPAEEMTPTQSPEPEPSTAQTVPAAEEFERAAAQSTFPLYIPTYVPGGFVYLPEESTVEPDLVAIAYGSGTARVLVIQGVWDLGEQGESISENVRFGPLQARMSKGRFAWEGPAYGQDALVVMAQRPETGVNYAVISTGLDEAQLLTVARRMAVPR